jgi:hypothetical protein
MTEPRVDPASGDTPGGYDYGLTDKCGQCYEVLCVNGMAFHSSTFRS